MRESRETTGKKLKICYDHGCRTGVAEMRQWQAKSPEADEMKLSRVPARILAVLLFCCPQPADHFPGMIDPNGMTVESRIRTPQGFQRLQAADASFAFFLRRLPLKPHGAKVLLYDGRIKENNGVYDAVVDLAIGNKNLHQCADAVIRLRAEYLYRQKRFQQIHFNFTNGFRADYVEWRKGKRVVVQGNQTYWAPAQCSAATYRDFWNYLEVVFSYAGTRSLARELEPASVGDLRSGDVFIQGGSPGHAVIVVDMAVDPQNSEKIFLLAQSYMPAQELQILKNPADRKLSPWYSTGFGDILATPEWTFSRTDLKRFAPR
jgi:hypothetical protein